MDPVEKQDIKNAHTALVRAVTHSDMEYKKVMLDDLHRIYAWILMEK